MSPASPIQHSRKSFLYWAAGLLLGIAAFIPAIVAWFTAEDLTLIYTVRDSPFDMWSGTDGIAGFFRPVVTIIIWATYNLFGLEPRPFHLVNVILHLANSLLVFAVARGWTRLLPDGHRLENPAFACVAALWFWIWPSHSEPVSWIPALTDVSAATFGLASLAAYIRGRNNGNLWWITGAILLYGIGLCAKESVIALPGVIFLYEASRYRLQQSTIGRSVAGVAAYAAMMLIYFQARYLILGAYVGGYGTAMHTDFTWARVQWTLSPNLINAFLPLPVDNVIVKNWILAVLIIAASVAILWQCRRSGDSPIVILSMFVATFAVFVPALNLGPHFITEGQRFSYLPSAFGVLTSAAVMVYLLPRGRALAIISLAVAIAGAGILAWYNSNWYYAGKITRKAVRGIKKLPEARRLYVLVTTKAYREAFILPHSLDIVAKTAVDNPPVKEMIMTAALNYWDPSVKLSVSPATSGSTTYTVTMSHNVEPGITAPRLEPFGIGLFAQPLFVSTGGGDTYQVVLKEYDPTVDKIAYLNGGEWVILP